MKIWIAVLMLALVTLPAVSVFAQEKAWSDEAELSFVDTGGNTQVTTLSAKNLLKKGFSERVTGTWKLQALYGKTDGEKTAESYMTELRGDYAQTERLYYFTSVGWLQDKFAGTDSRYTVGLGTGYKVLNGPKHVLLAEAGLTYTMEDYTDGTSENYPGGRLFGQYDYDFTEKNKFTQTLEFLPDFKDSKNWLLNSETALIAGLNSALSMKTGYQVKYDNQPVPGTKSTDTILAVTLVVNF